MRLNEEKLEDPAYIITKLTGKMMVSDSVSNKGIPVGMLRSGIYVVTVDTKKEDQQNVF